MNAMQFFIRCMFCGIPALMLSVIPYFFEPTVGRILFAVVFFFGWQLTKPNPVRDEDWKHGQNRYRKSNHWRT